MTTSNPLERPFAWLLDRSHTLRVVSPVQSRVDTIAKVNIDLSIGANRVLSASRDGRFAIAVNAYDVTDVLARYDLDGSVAWSVRSGSYTAVVVAKNGYSYAIKKGGGQSSQVIVQKIVSDTGRIERQIDLPERYFDIAVDERNENLWLGGEALTRLDLDLNRKWTIDPIAWYAVSIDVAPDGTLLAVERKYRDGMGENRLLRIDLAGQIVNDIALEFPPMQVAASRGTWDVWVLGAKAARFNPKDGGWDHPKVLDIGPAAFAAADRHGVLWLAAKDRLLRVSRNGEVISQTPGLQTEKACLALVDSE